VIATGRMLKASRPYALAAGLEGPVVCYQGALVAEAGNGRVIHHDPIPLQLAREAISALEAAGYSPNTYVDDELYVAELSEASRLYGERQNVAVHEVGDLLAWLARPPTKLVAVGDPERLDVLEGELRARFDGELFVAKSLSYFLEIANGGVTKGSGLAVVARELGFSLARTVSFGDGENDVELLEAAAFGVAVGNAHPRVAAVADWSCPGPDTQGVARAIEAILARR
jgi:Cof subfamily protein (haloacid dehalogenase superfamily)